MDKESNKIIERLQPKIGRGWKKGRPRSKITNALIQTDNAVKQIEDTFNKMSDRDRKIFVALTSGDDELIAMLKAGHYKGIKDIVKIVYDKESKPFEVKYLTIDNVDTLDVFSYERLLKIAKSEVKHILGKTDYRNFITDVTDLFKLIAPDQVAVLASISGNVKSKDSDRIKAANSILDRAGYDTDDGKKKEIVNPVQVNVIIGGKPKAEFNPIITVEPQKQT